jgi:hypothetical protein
MLSLGVRRRRRLSLTISLKIISSETTEQMLTKLCRNNDWDDLYKQSTFD